MGFFGLTSSVKTKVVTWGSLEKMLSSARGRIRSQKSLCGLPCADERKLLPGGGSPSRGTCDNDDDGCVGVDVCAPLRLRAAGAPLKLGLLLMVCGFLCSCQCSKEEEEGGGGGDSAMCMAPLIEPGGRTWWGRAR